MKNDEFVEVKEKSETSGSTNLLSDGVGSSVGGAAAMPLQGVADSKGKGQKRRVYHIQSRYMQPPGSSTKENTPMTTKDVDRKPSAPMVKKSLFKGVSLTPSRSNKPPPKKVESPATSTPALLQTSMMSVPKNISCIPKKPSVHQIQRPTSATNRVPSANMTNNLKIRKPQVPAGGVGPMLGLPPPPSSVDGTTHSNSSDESYLVYSRYIAAKFLHLKSKDSLEKLSADATNKLWRMSQMNKELYEKKTALEVELNTFRRNRLLREHLLKQREILERLTEELPRFVTKFSELASSLDACLHYLPLKNVRLPQGPEELERLSVAVDKLSVTVDSALSTISPSSDRLSDLADCLSSHKSILTGDVEDLERYKVVLLELKKVSTHDSFLMMKTLQKKTFKSDHTLFGCDDLVLV